MRKRLSEVRQPGERSKEKQLRTCLGCGLKDRQEHLLALALRDGLVVPDAERRLPGRHAYCCRNAACMGRLVRNRKRIARALRAEAVQFDEGLHNLFGSVA